MPCLQSPVELLLGKAFLSARCSVASWACVSRIDVAKLPGNCISFGLLSFAFALKTLAFVLIVFPPFVEMLKFKLKL